MDFVLWEQILTSVIATGLTLLIVQYIKPWKFLQRIDTRAIVLIVANILLQSAAFVMRLSLDDHFLLVINSFIVASAAIGAYQENALNFRKSDELAKTGDQ